VQTKGSGSRRQCRQVVFCPPLIAMFGGALLVYYPPHTTISEVIAFLQVTFTPDALRPVLVRASCVLQNHGNAAAMPLRGLMR
jgi:hypothetical protein